MQEILRHINSVEGVIGSAVLNERGDVLDHAFPALIDGTAIRKAAALTLECAHGLQIPQSLEILDLRYADGRVIVKVFPNAMIYLLCAKNINLQVLTITLNLAVRKLEALLVPREQAPVDLPKSSLSDTRDEEGALKLRISHLANREASSSFDSLGMIAVSQPTAKYIGEFYRSAIKKLTLTNPAAGTSGTFPVMVMNDIDTVFDGTIIVGPSIEKKLKVSENDKVEVKIG